MNDQDDSNPKSNEMPGSDAAPRIHIERKTPARLGWQSARVTISSPEFPSPITVTVHWREASTCYIGFRRFSQRGATPNIEERKERGLQDAEDV